MKGKDGYEITHTIIAIIKPILVLIILGFVYLFIYQKLGVGIPCLFRTITGWKCPGCGMTHAMSAIWNGDWKSAWEYNALSITVLPIVCIYLLYRWVREIRHKGEEFYIWEYIFLGVLFIIVIAYGYTRNTI
ncbi:MAG: DUF2752 domain-containing protein [Clostridium sp.]|nr:DUF2752 domain-containing protein [Clostridium sp.]